MYQQQIAPLTERILSLQGIKSKALELQLRGMRESDERTGQEFEQLHNNQGVFIQKPSPVALHRTCSKNSANHICLCYHSGKYSKEFLRCSKTNEGYYPTRLLRLNAHSLQQMSTFVWSDVSSLLSTRQFKHAIHSV